jgi:hypothetical protein
MVQCFRVTQKPQIIQNILRPLSPLIASYPEQLFPIPHLHILHLLLSFPIFSSYLCQILCSVPFSSHLKKLFNIQNIN